MDLGSDYALPMAQVSYQVEEQSYTYQALQTSQSEDISGQSGTWSSGLSWRQGDIELRLCSNEEENWVGWYVAEAQTQWVAFLSANSKPRHRNLPKKVLSID